VPKHWHRLLALGLLDPTTCSNLVREHCPGLRGFFGPFDALFSRHFEHPAVFGCSAALAAVDDAIRHQHGNPRREAACEHCAYWTFAYQPPVPAFCPSYARCAWTAPARTTAAKKNNGVPGDCTKSPFRIRLATDQRRFISHAPNFVNRGLDTQ